MAETIHEGQAVLFAVTPASDRPLPRLPILAWRGEAVDREIRHYGREVMPEWAGTALPDTLGFHVWEGEHIPDPNNPEAPEFYGTIRPATLADFARFGFPVPGAAE